ncbi:MAG: hypothetical protein NTX48_10350 [Planctomycetales bacterium]|nr:hypothetical protein [Planctomycetales bacterium]
MADIRSSAGEVAGNRCWKVVVVQVAEHRLGNLFMFDGHLRDDGASGLSCGWGFRV